MRVEMCRAAIFNGLNPSDRSTAVWPNEPVTEMSIRVLLSNFSLTALADDVIL